MVCSITKHVILFTKHGESTKNIRAQGRIHILCVPKDHRKSILKRIFDDLERVSSSFKDRYGSHIFYSKNFETRVPLIRERLIFREFISCSLWRDSCPFGAVAFLFSHFPGVIVTSHPRSPPCVAISCSMCDSPSDSHLSV